MELAGGFGCLVWYFWEGAMRGAAMGVEEMERSLYMLPSEKRGDDYGHGSCRVRVSMGGWVRVTEIRALLGGVQLS